MIKHIQKLKKIKNNEILDYKNIDLLRKFITEQGKILPKRMTYLTSKQQKKLTKAVKRARILALLPFSHKE